MNIGVTNRDGILSQNFTFQQLRAAGVKALEYYMSDLPDRWYQTAELGKAASDAGFEVVIHLPNQLKDLTGVGCFLEGLVNDVALRVLVFHPVWIYTDPRSTNRVNTSEQCSFFSEWSSGLPVICCLENLPYSASALNRYGDNIGEVAANARSAMLGNCFDTGHYFSGQGTDSFTELTVVTASRIEHLHIHAFIDGQDHHPLQDDDGSLQDLVTKFRLLRPEYEGIYSIEIVPFGHSPDEAVLGSIATLRSFLGE